MQNERIEEPLCFVTDRELALMNALDTTFPNSAHLLCTWHVNMNILANCRKHFAKDKADPNKPSSFIPDPGWEAFLKDWASVLDSSTEAEYTSRLTLFRKHSKVATDYYKDTWLKWREKLVRFWVNQNLHFGDRITSPIEGCHAVLKMYSKVSTSDLKGVFDRLVLFWPEQHRNIYNTIAIESNKVKHNVG
jgi:hypothetical protein